MSQDVAKHQSPFLKNKTAKSLAKSHQPRHKYGTIYKQYKNEKPNKQNAFYKTHRQELTLFESAEKYLKQLLKGKPIPLKSWQAENTKLTTEKQKLYKDYYTLKEEVRQVEIVKTIANHVVKKDLTRNKSKSFHKI